MFNGIRWKKRDLYHKEHDSEYGNFNSVKNSQPKQDDTLWNYLV